MKPRKGRVLIDGQAVGTIEETKDRGFRFQYAPQWVERPDAVPVSLTLPLRAEPYDTQELHPFFENLLPEGWFLDIAAQTLKISKSDPFGLLLATCGDCAGAAEIQGIE